MISRFAAEGPNRNSKDGCPCCRAVPKQFIQNGNRRRFFPVTHDGGICRISAQVGTAGLGVSGGEKRCINAIKKMRYNDTDP